MYPKSKESSVNIGWEEQKRRRDGKKVGWIAELRMDGLQGWGCTGRQATEEEGVLVSNLGT